VNARRYQPVQREEKDLSKASTDEIRNHRKKKKNGRPVRAVDESKRPEDKQQSNQSRQNPRKEEVVYQRERRLASLCPQTPTVPRTLSINPIACRGQIALHHLQETVIHGA
jgi:hypothetical protein